KPGKQEVEEEDTEILNFNPNDLQIEEYFNIEFPNIEIPDLGYRIFSSFMTPVFIFFWCFYRGILCLQSMKKQKDHKILSKIDQQWIDFLLEQTSLFSIIKEEYSIPS